MSEQEDDRNDVSSARSRLETIVEYYELYQELQDGADTVEVEGEEVEEDEFQDYIQGDVLQVGVRDSGFWTPGWENCLDLRSGVPMQTQVSDAGGPDPDEYMVLLATGGPAVRIWGDIGLHGEPSTARIQQQDWFTPWKTVHDTTDEEDEALLWYAQQFYWGDV